MSVKALPCCFYYCIHAVYNNVFCLY